jgi:hypothetical protein
MANLLPIETLEAVVLQRNSVTVAPLALCNGLTANKEDCVAVICHKRRKFVAIVSMARSGRLPWTRLLHLTTTSTVSCLDLSLEK